MIRVTHRTLVVLTIVAWSATSRESLAQVVPYKASGTGIYSPITSDYSGPGVGTHLGSLTYFGNVAIFPTGNPLVYEFQGTVPQENIAANGDKLYFSLSGQVELIPLDATFTTFSAIWTGEFVVVGGTGRFAAAGPAAEPLQVIAINDPFALTDPEWTFSWKVTGKIRLR